MPSAKNNQLLTIALFLLATIFAAGWLIFTPSTSKPGKTNVPSEPTMPSLESSRAELDTTVWAKEVSAQEHEKIFVHLWDRLRAGTEKHKILTRFPFNRLIIGRAQPAEKLEQGILRTIYSAPEIIMPRKEFVQKVNNLANQGYRLVQSEWHHSKFEQENNSSAKSTVSVVLHVKNPDQNKLLSIKANLVINWLSEMKPSPVPDSIAVTNLKILEKDSSVAFNQTHKLKGNPMVSPILVHDLNGNGFSDIIALGSNKVLFNTGGDFQTNQLHPKLPPILNTAVIADFTGDTLVDLITVDAKSNKLIILEGKKNEIRFAEPIDCWPKHLELPSVITAGDVDGDGDLDLFIGQYKQPYLKGQMPTPYYDANDGHPAYLLQNLGNGKFIDITEPSGLVKKRFRRTYGASLVDLNSDDKLDLVVSSDFAGIDIYEGNGKGAFKDLTKVWIDQRHTFGMSHVFADFNTDGKLDFFSVGMSSTTARRLDFMGLGRDDHKHIDLKRAAMSYGNRLYIANKKGFQQSPFNDQVSRTGWSWGCTAFDADNDSDTDIYVTNGHQSGKSAQDYCTTFWCHDIYTGDSDKNASVEKLFSKTMDKLINREISWNGFEHNAFLMNRGPNGFLETGFLLGVASEGDGRVTLSDDLNNDGRQDLILVESGFEQGGRVTQTLRIFSNLIETSNHWVGIKLKDTGLHFSPIGTKVTLRTRKGYQMDSIVTGDSLYGQHSSTIHFGLGDNESIDEIEVRWLNGTKKTLKNPPIDSYHLIESPSLQ